MAAGVAVDPSTLHDAWYETVLDVLTRATLTEPVQPAEIGRGRRGEHTAAADRAAGRDAGTAPRAPGGDVVTGTLDRTAAFEAAAAVLDPEVPVLTIADLGVLRDVQVREDGSVDVTITPTYSGCPAMQTIADDVTTALTVAGFRGVRVEHRAVAGVDDGLDER